MPFKINIGDKGKTLGGKSECKELKHELEGYEFEITGGSDISGFPLYKDAEGIGLKKVLLKKGWGMHDNREGVRLRKTVRSKTISNKVVQINLKAIKHGKKHLAEIFSDQNKAPETKQEQLAKESKEEKAIEVAA